MSAPFRDPHPDGVDVEVWPPVFELGPALIADRTKAARSMRTEVIHRAILRLFRKVVRRRTPSRTS